MEIIRTHLNIYARMIFGNIVRYNQKQYTQYYKQYRYHTIYCMFFIIIESIYELFCDIFIL
jgi:hypothetical protein